VSVGSLLDNVARVHEITVPVLLVLGSRDLLMCPPPADCRAELDTHLARFSGTDDKRGILVNNTGHLVFMEKNRDHVRRKIGRWLTDHRF
jgi:pimeloyl-ACP methyl ester carboxylesterase